MFWLHGMGQSGADYLELFTEVVPPCTKVIFLNAPKRKVEGSDNQELNAWYNMKDLQSKLQPGEDPLDRYEQVDIEASAQYLVKRVESLRRELGDKVKVHIGGFSQGCTVSLAALVKHNFEVQSCVGICCMFKA